MASSPTISFFILSSFLFLSCSFSNARTSPKPKGFIFPIRKDDTTNQYYTTIQIGSNVTTFNAVIDLGGKFLWFNTAEYLAASGTQFKVRDFPFQLSDPLLRVGLATPTAGLVGLGRTNVSLPAYLSSAFEFREKFALCIPSSGTNGNTIIGEGVYRAPFQEISDSNPTTPLIRNPVSVWPTDQIGFLAVEYYIGVTSIKVGENALALNKTLLSIDEKTGGGGTSIRTVRPYTILHKSIYEALVKEFVKAAGAKKIKTVAAVAPFGACFDSKTISSTKTGPDVPTVDLVLHNEKVYWRLYGSNSMVRVSEGVMCLAFVEGRSGSGFPSTAIVVGGYQLENQLLEFDVSASKLGFSSSLLLRDTTCSHFGAA